MSHFKGFGDGNNSNGQFWYGNNGFQYKKNGGGGSRRNPPIGLICNKPTYLHNKYKPGTGGVGSSSIAIRRAKNRLATVCDNSNCGRFYNYLGLGMNFPNPKPNPNPNPNPIILNGTVIYSFNILQPITLFSEPMSLYSFTPTINLNEIPVPLITDGATGIAVFKATNILLPSVLKPLQLLVLILTLSPVNEDPKTTVTAVSGKVTAVDDPLIVAPAGGVQT
jgi:hypothetical protein